MTQTTTKALPECLHRVAADDRDDAALRCTRPHGMSPEAETVFGIGCDGCEHALAAIQREQAEAVFNCARSFLSGGSTYEVAEWASEAAYYAGDETHENGRLNASQRARLLDAARALVALAIEVSS